MCFLHKSFRDSDKLSTESVDNFVNRRFKLVVISLIASLIDGVQEGCSPIYLFMWFRYDAILSKESRRCLNDRKGESELF